MRQRIKRVFEEEPVFWAVWVLLFVGILGIMLEPIAIGVVRWVILVLVWR